MPHLKAHQFALPSKSDHYALQKMIDAAIKHATTPTLGDAANGLSLDDRKFVYADARGDAWFLRDRKNSNDLHETLEFKVNGNDWVTVCLDFTGSRITGTGNARRNLFEIENMGSGNLRDVRVTGGNWRGGRVGIKVRGTEYSQLDNMEITHSWLAALDVKGHGTRSVRLVNIGIQEPRGFSAILERDVEFFGLRACEGVGTFVCKNGNFAFRDSHLSGFNLSDPVVNWPSAGWGDGITNMWELVGQPIPLPLKSGRQTKPIFNLSGAASLHFNGYIRNSYSPGVDPIEETNPLRANTIFHQRYAGNLNVDADILLTESVEAIVAEEYLHAHKDEYWTDVRLRGLEAQSSLYLHQRTLPHAPTHPGYGSNETVRSRRNFSGYIRMKNGGQIIQDAHAPVDLSSVDIITA